MSQDNDSIQFDDEPIKIEGDDEPIRIESDEAPTTIESDEAPLSIEPPDEEPLTIAEGGSGRSISHAKGIRGAGDSRHEFARPMNNTGKGATRCRIFRSKISVPALDGLEEHINDWLDSDEIDVKDVGHLIGTMHGKTDEDNIIVFIWH